MGPRRALLAALVSGFLTVQPASSATVGTALPPLVVWAWESPQDLRFLDPRRHGVAVLVGSVELVGDTLRVRARRQPLAVPADAAIAAVVRIESDAGEPPTLSPAQSRSVADAVLGWIRPGEVAAVQIDFDAARSERTFYRRLLTDLRRRLPAGMPLQITALASWCLGDPWLRSLPVDEAVPMLFRMGRDAPAILRALDGGGDFSSAVCRESVGVSTDEALPRIPAGRRVFVFHPGPWTPQVFSRLTRQLEARRR